MEEIYFPVLKIIREEEAGRTIDYHTGDVIRIYSFEGRLVQTVAVVDGQAFIDMSVYSSGTYILVSGTQVFNVIKK